MNWAGQVLRHLTIGAALALGISGAQAQPARAPIPIELMIREPFLSQVQLSPNGEHMAALSSIDGQERSLAIWRTSSLSSNPTRIGVSGLSARGGVKFESFIWVSNDRLMVFMSQPVDLGSGAENRTYTSIVRFVDLTGRQWIEPLGAAGARRSEDQRFIDQLAIPQLIDTLPRDDRNVLMVHRTPEGTNTYRVDVNTGRGERLNRLSDEESPLGFTDPEGDLRVRQFARFEGGNWMIGHEILDEASNTWRVHPALTYPANARRNMSVLNFDPENPDRLLVLDTENSNFAYARSYSISQGAFVETLYQNSQYDVNNIVLERVNGVPRRIVGFSYNADVTRVHYTDPGYRAIQERLQRALPGRVVYIGSPNGNHRIIVAESSAHPPAYYMMTNDQQISALGDSIPNFPSATLAPTQFVTYQARDGLTIPAFLTLPQGWRVGDAPLPVIIQPHGGPWGRNDASWGGGDIAVTQYFASRGFAVLQPQFRGSMGFGQELWRAGDNEWGQKMQDDKDDGLAWLVQQGVADPQRAVIYGFSYGGFAAMAAIVRPNPPYRCAISGAGVSSLERLGTLWRTNRVQRQLQGLTVGGFDPLQHASDASIPILIYHGDRDQTAPIWHSERFRAALGSRPHEYVVIQDMAHGASTPAMRRQEYEIVENFLRGPCGISF